MAPDDTHLPMAIGCWVRNSTNDDLGGTIEVNCGMHHESRKKNLLTLADLLP
jgi:hypothetical protein